MRRSRLTQALLLSLALHAGLWLLLSRVPVAPEPPPPDVIQIEVFEHASAPPTPAPEPPAPPRRSSPPAHAKTSPSKPPPQATAEVSPPSAPTPPSTSTPPAASASGPAPSTEPAPADTPRTLRLYPGPEGLAVSPNLGLPLGTPSGHTWRPGDGPTPGQLREEERERVHGRVQGFVEDDLATLNVENGLADTYFGDMHRAMDKGLTGAPLFSYQGVLKHFFKAGPHTTQTLHDLFAGAGRFGATGTPDPMGEPSGSSLEEVARSGTAGARARSQPSNAERLDTLSRSSGTLHAELDLEQSRTGQVLGVKLLVSSGNPLFDAFVLENVPKSLASLGPAPEHFAAHHLKDTLRSVWSVDGFVSFSRTLKFSKLSELDASDAAYISALIPMGVLSGNFEELRGEVIIPDIRRPHFETRTKLLRVY